MSAAQLPMVTVVTVVYQAVKDGRADKFKQCLESVRQQVGTNVEHVVVDGGSVDGTVGIVEDFKSSIRQECGTAYDFRWISEPDTGIYDAMNKGLEMARGKYIAFLNSDDYYHDVEGLRNSVAALERSGADFSFAPAVIIGVDDKPESRHPHVRPMPENFFTGMVFSHQSVLVKTDRMRAMGGYDLRYRSSADYDFLMRLVFEREKSCYVPRPFVTFRRGGFCFANMETAQTETGAIYADLFSRYLGINITPEEGREIYLHKKDSSAQLRAAQRPYLKSAFGGMIPPRILFSSSATNKSNPFVNVIYDKLCRLGCSVETGSDKFWPCNPSDYDILQLEWPEDLVGWKLEELTDNKLEDVKNRLAAFHMAGCKICYTRHNTIPHNVQNDLTAQLYRIVEDAADAVFHMSEYSKRQLLSNHSSSSQQHFIIPHHTYEDFDRTISKEEARLRLGLDPEDKIVLAFGAFRNEAEKNLTREAVANCKVPRLKLLAPRLEGNFVCDEELPDYFAAADVVFIQRLEILNSGNLPMAFYFGKVVVGPNVGNVGEILSRTGNPVYNPSSLESAAQALEDGFSLALSGLGVKNQLLANQEWNASRIARKMLDAYAECCGIDFLYLSRHPAQSVALREKLAESQKRRSEIWKERCELAEKLKSLQIEKRASDARRAELFQQLQEAQQARGRNWDERCAFLEERNRLREQLREISKLVGG